jgi:polysaccharide deacetylase family protein (PEP-CTERM system associated)
MRNILTIDVEEYFHPSEVQRSIPIEEWSGLPSRVETSTDRILELLDQRSTRATFFVLGWVADRHPALIRRIAEAGHEVACHSYAHQLVYSLTPEEFREDTERAIDAIGNAVGFRPTLYRAPSFSITNRSLWALEILVECGFQYDSSIFPISHDRYGIPGFKRHAQVLRTPSGPIFEVPAATTELMSGTIVPVAGGAYMRILPYRYMAAGIRRVNQKEQRPACIYLHPWEIDVDQPRIAHGFVSQIRTYTGIAGMAKKLARLVTDFHFAPVSTVYPDLCESALESVLLTSAGLNQIGVP